MKRTAPHPGGPAPDAAALRAYARRLRAQVAAERRLVSRELHDTPAQLLTAAQMELNWLRLKLPADAATLLERLDHVIASLGKAGASIRGVMSRLCPKMLETVGLPGALEWRVLELRRSSEVTCSLSIPPDLPQLAPDLAATLYAIADEYLSALETSDTRNVEICLKTRKKRVVFFLRISGSDALPKKDDVIDLTDIYERVQDAGGRIEQFSRSVIECSFPVRN